MDGTVFGVAFTIGTHEARLPRAELAQVFKDRALRAAEYVAKGYGFPAKLTGTQRRFGDGTTYATYELFFEKRSDGKTNQATLADEIFTTLFAKEPHSDQGAHMPYAPHNFNTTLERAVRKLAEREEYLHRAQVLGMSRDEAETFDAAVIAYAATCIAPNKDLWSAVWREAMASLARGEGLPTIPEE